LNRILTVVSLGLAASAFVLAQTLPAPEINPGSATEALALVGGAILLFRQTTRKR